MEVVEQTRADKNEDKEGEDSEGNEAEGDEAEGNDEEGDEAEGDETVGEEAEDRVDGADGVPPLALIPHSGLGRE